ncbi:MAG: hypothetical protein RQ899_07535 [Pseudomonadales bacterium]|nr:hypothetical protein [Pseudomonadales bacterium]
MSINNLLKFIFIGFFSSISFSQENIENNIDLVDIIERTKLVDDRSIFEIIEDQEKDYDNYANRDISTGLEVPEYVAIVMAIMTSGSIAKEFPDRDYSILHETNDLIENYMKEQSLMLKEEVCVNFEDLSVKEDEDMVIKADDISRKIFEIKYNTIQFITDEYIKLLGNLTPKSSESIEAHKAKIYPTLRNNEADFSKWSTNDPKGFVDTWSATCKYRNIVG